MRTQHFQKLFRGQLLPKCPERIPVNNGGPWASQGGVHSTLGASAPTALHRVPEWVVECVLWGAPETQWSQYTD